jgi:hypothetical protein
MPINATDLNKAYLAYFGRPADFTGKTYFATLEEADVIAAFDASAESQALYGSDVAAKVNAIYNNLFNRDAEPAGLTYWVTLIQQGRVTPAGAAIAILKGAQGTDATSVENKLAASEAFVQEIDTTAEILGYSGAAAAASARAWLKTVGETEASLTAAVAGVSEAVADAAAVGGPAGQNFTLTTGIDTITGTSGNDTINAFASGAKADGSDATTLGANDTINGGAGVDTLNIEVLAGAPGFNQTIQGNISNVEKVFITNGADLAADLDVTKLGSALQEAWQVTTARGVTEVTTQAVGFKNVDTVAGGAVVAYGATTKSGTIALDNSGKGSLTVDVQGAVLETLNVAGSVKAANATTAGTVILTDDANGSGAGTVGSVKTLNLNLSTAATVNVAGLDKLETIASTGAGNLNLGASLTNVVKSVTTGAGDDTFTLATATTALINASASTGAGKDTITVNTTGTAGTVTIDAGAGDDSIVFSRALNVRDKVNGGDGKDTLTVGGTGLIAEDYEVLKAVVSNVETLKFSAAMAGADASKLSQFSGFSFTTDASSITKVADAQTIATTGDLTVAAAGYVAKGSGTPAATATTYAGTLTVEASGGILDADPVTAGNQTDNVVVTANASAVDMTVKATAATASAAGTASFASLTGDVQTATVNLVNSVNAATSATATADVLANFSLVTGSAVDGGGAFTALGGLTSLTLTGNGAATVTNGAGSKLATIDASGMTGVAAYDATKVAGGLTFTGLDTLAESIKLGGGLDKVVTASTYDKMDTISNFTLVAAAGGTTTVDTAKSDDIQISGYGVDGTLNFVKTTVTGDTLGLAFIDAAAKAENAVVFQFGGDTYAFVDATGAGVLDNADLAVKLTGTIDLDLLVNALNTGAIA